MRQFIFPNCATTRSNASQLVHVDTKLPQVDLGQRNLIHQLPVRRGDIIEGQEAPAEAEEEKCAKGNESPGGEDRDDLLLKEGWQRDQLKVESEVE